MLKKSKFKNLKQIGEFGLISRIQTSLQTHSRQTLIGIGDDCALIKPKTGTILAVSCDSLVEGVHFNLSISSFIDLGWKAIAVNLSDIASMGGTPKWALASLTIPKHTSIKSIDQLYEGFNRACSEYQIELVGGDTVSSPNGLGVHITILGEIEQKKCFFRSGAKTGDKIFVTGTLGDSSLGLKILKSRKTWKGLKKHLSFLIDRHLQPTPRLKESKLLSRLAPDMGGMIDISDGLLQDLKHLCLASGVGATLESSSLPKSLPFEKIIVKNKLSYSELIFSGGEDYELLFTFRPENVNKLKHKFLKAGKRLTQIGTVTSKYGQIVLKEPSGKTKIIRKTVGFNHFST